MCGAATAMLFARPATAAPQSESKAGWAALDRRPNPPWFDDAKLGIFIHWSLFSVPAVAWVYPDKPYGYGGHSCWYGLYVDRLRPLRSPEQQALFEVFHRKTYGDVPFKALAAFFKGEAFDSRQWAALLKRAGARYAFLTSNFHDGYCLWPSPYNRGWNSLDTGPKRDVLGEFCAAMREEGLRAGFYYSIGEFNHPLYQAARKAGGDMKAFVREHLQPQLREAVKRYRPSFLYFDGEWEFPLDAFEMRGFLAWLYAESECKDEVAVNDRFGRGSRGKHGGVYSSEAGVRESGTEHKWCEDRPLSRGNWSYNRLERLEDYLSARDLIHLLVETVAQGGNLHVAISPSGDGSIPMLQQERLVQLGDWLRVNGEAIYGTRPWTTSHEGPMVESINPRLDEKWRWTETRQRPLVHYTRRSEAVYAVCLAKPTKPLVLTAAKGINVGSVTLLGSKDKVMWTTTDAGLRLELPPDIPGEHAWVFRIEQRER
jgi:alpha-L-fucosidase